MTDTCSICHDSSAHKLRAYLQDSLSSSNLRSADDTLSCGLDVSPWKHELAPRSER
jgi:hypothetical protein